MIRKSERLIEVFDKECAESVVGSEYTVHQVSPYIGKIKSSIAKFLVENFTSPGDFIYDPFCGAGTIPLEAWALGRNVIANDLNAYAVVLTKAKLFPPQNTELVVKDIERLNVEVMQTVDSVSLETVPDWVKDFFHEETLKEIIIWVKVLKEKKRWFILSCLLGILHHQRPGFLSFPSSHTVPYLRVKKFPPSQFPELYEYRNVKGRLIKKVCRALKRHPNLDTSLFRKVYNKDASACNVKIAVDAIITSPPYMRQLDYARDNRLRLWFLGLEDHRALDLTISPKENDFLETITACFHQWNDIIKVGGKCILFLGDNYSKRFNMTLPELIEKIMMRDIGGFKLLFKHESVIPDNRRVRRNHTGNKAETILVFKKTK